MWRDCLQLRALYLKKVIIYNRTFISDSVKFSFSPTTNLLSISNHIIPQILRKYYLIKKKTCHTRAYRGYRGYWWKISKAFSVLNYFSFFLWVLVGFLPHPFSYLFPSFVNELIFSSFFPFPFSPTKKQFFLPLPIFLSSFFFTSLRQGCNLSPALFNIYIDDFLWNWKHKADAGIMFKRNIYLNTLLFADDEVIIQDSEDKLQKSIY